MGEVYESNDLLQMFTGVSLQSDGAFSSSVLQEVSDFIGVLHYQVIQPCEEIRTTTLVDLDFAINESPQSDIVLSLNEAVEGALNALMVLNANLIRFERFHMLEIVQVNSNVKQGYGKYGFSTTTLENPSDIIPYIICSIHGSELSG